MVHSVRTLLRSWPDAPKVVSAFAPAKAYSARTPVFGGGIAVYDVHLLSTIEAEFGRLLSRLRFHPFSGSTSKELVAAAQSGDLHSNFWLSDGNEIRRAADNGRLDWNEWLSIMHKWAKDFCFLEVDGKFGVGLSTDVELVENVGLVVDFVLSDAPGDKHKRDTGRSWIFHLGHVNTNFDSTIHKYCMCTLIQLPRDALDWTVLDGMCAALHKVKQPQTSLEHFLNFLVLRCERQQCYTAIVSDGLVTCVMHVDPEKLSDSTYMITLTCQTFASETWPLAYCLAALLSKFSTSLEYSEPPLLGAVNRQPKSSRSLGSPQCFRDFDDFQLCWDSVYFGYFQLWKAKAAKNALAHRLSTGTTLTVNRAAVPRQLSPWRCPFPKVAVPGHILESIAGVFRARDNIADDLLGSTQPLEFEIEEVVQEGEDRWSQVFMGKLRSTGKHRSASTSLCLKLFDERLFPIPSLSIFDRKDAHAHIRNELHYADTMIRREESAYHRLSEYQGSLLPHFYGCHEFVLPGNLLSGGHKVLGILMEKIEGVPLSELLETRSWDYEQSVGLFKRLGDIVKLLNASCITQGDWHLNQIMCIEREARGTSPSQSIDLVLIDFAFALQPLTTKHAILDMTDRRRLGQELQLDSEMKRSIGWDDYEEDEWPELEGIPAL